MNGITGAFIRFCFYECLVTDRLAIHGSMKSHTKGRYETIGINMAEWQAGTCLASKTLLRAAIQTVTLTFRFKHVRKLCNEF
jgi:hypothetical protein